MKIRALSFDVYGTLIDWETGIAAFLVPWAEAQGCTLDREELLVKYAGHEAEAARRRPDSLYPDILATALVGLAGDLGLEAASEQQDTFGRSVPDWPAFDDSAAALRLLKQHAQLIVLSNIDNASFAGSDQRLGRPFDAVITAEDVGSYKPARRNFQALQAKLDELGIAPADHLHVAQSLFHDHVPARAVGMRTAWINRRHDTPGWGATPDPQAAVEPDYEFRSMQEFADAIAAGALSGG